MSRRGISSTVSVEVDIDIGDFISDIDDSYIVDEVKERELYEELSEWFYKDMPEEDLLDALKSRLTLTQGDALEEAFDKIKNG